MLDPSWAWTRPLLWVAVAALLAVLVIRAIRKDRREYQQFKRFTATAARQRMFRKWLLESFLQFGGLSVGALLLAGFAVAPLLSTLADWPGVRDLRRLVHDEPGITLSVVGGALVALVVLTIFAAGAARKEQEVMTVGDISAMLPRNRQELLLGGLLSVNAGIVEELLFRLALPALVFGASGNAIVAVVFTVLLFGALHVYQGVAGVIGTTVIGAIFMLLYAVTGTILVPIIVHALFDLRSLVLIPVAVFRVHRIDGAAPAATPAVAPGSAPAAPAGSPTPAHSPAASTPGPSV
ncbi:hypothetical protein BH11ACT4_BH11ACT4_17950 [soil metagenome]